MKIIVKSHKRNGKVVRSHGRVKRGNKNLKRNAIFHLAKHAGINKTSPEHEDYSDHVAKTISLARYKMKLAKPAVKESGTVLKEHIAKKKKLQSKSKWAVKKLKRNEQAKRLGLL